MQLLKQFEALYLNYQGLHTRTNVHEISNLLNCSLRNARNVLKKLDNAGWIKWSPAIGRTHVSELEFLETLISLQRKQVLDLLIRNEYRQIDKSFILKNKFHFDEIWLEQYLGQVSIYRLPIKFSQFHLTQFKTKGLSDQNFLNKFVFNNLVSLDLKSGNIKPHLCDKFELLSDQVTWRFYLRKNIFCHDGHILNTLSVLKALQQNLHNNFIYKHIVNMNARKNWIDFTLTHKDLMFPFLMTRPEATIRMMGLDGELIGTGPYVYRESTNQVISFQLFEQFYNLSPSYDSIELINLDNKFFNMLETINHERAGFIWENYSQLNGSGIIYMFINQHNPNIQCLHELLRPECLIQTNPNLISKYKLQNSFVFDKNDDLHSDMIEVNEPTLINNKQVIKIGFFKDRLVDHDIAVTCQKYLRSMGFHVSLVKLDYIKFLNQNSTDSFDVLITSGYYCKLIDLMYEINLLLRAVDTTNNMENTKLLNDFLQNNSRAEVTRKQLNDFFYQLMEQKICKPLFHQKKLNYVLIPEINLTLRDIDPTFI